MKTKDVLIIVFNPPKSCRSLFKRHLGIQRCMNIEYDIVQKPFNKALACDKSHRLEVFYVARAFLCRTGCSTAFYDIVIMSPPPLKSHTFSEILSRARGSHFERIISAFRITTKLKQ